MSNVKVLPPDAFILNCKMMQNDVSQIRDRIKRMWASAEGERDMAMLEHLEELLGLISSELHIRLDKS